ncbi:MAG: c-type cytochrome [Novosphingobium sp.]
MSGRAVLVMLLAALPLAGCSSHDDAKREAAPSARVAATPGERVFDRWCVQCHGQGARYPGTASLAVKYGKDLPAALEKRQDLTPETVALFVRRGISVMPPFRKTEITDEELASLGAYLAHRPENGLRNKN